MYDATCAFFAPNGDMIWKSFNYNDGEETKAFYERIVNACRTTTPFEYYIADWSDGTVLEGSQAMRQYAGVVRKAKHCKTDFDEWFREVNYPKETLSRVLCAAYVDMERLQNKLCDAVKFQKPGGEKETIMKETIYRLARVMADLKLLDKMD